ncbi:MAG TPA: Smr/MutS family protein [Candidatus Limnocylindrales bacterium]|nr:Smr/MutS family protein [Candidatus Limnocylindrales bacterium]
MLAIRPHARLDDALSAQELTRDVIALSGTAEEPPSAAPPDVRPLLEQLETEGAVLSGEELWQIRLLLDQAALAHAWARKKNRQETPGLSRLLADVEPLPALHRELGRTLEPSGEVRDDASPDLTRIRRSIKTLRERLAQKLESMARGLGIADTFVTLRDGRYAIAVPASERRKVPGVALGYSGSGATVFLEPREAAEANSELSDLFVDEVREVNRILRELSGTAGRDRDALARDLDCLARLDAAQAVASWARSSGGTMPTLTEERELVLRGARHPILVGRHERGEMESSPVPLDLELNEGSPLLLVTGPNMGGKTVALKATGLLALLAMAGLPVPAAEGTRVPWFDHVVCDIGDEQSLMEDVSTFLSHLRRVAEAISVATPRSLVLLDELGSGTDPTEGAALGQAILERLLERRTLCIATTHHGALKSFAQETPGVRNASMAFDEETLKPRFTLIVGVPGRSRAIQVAERFGMDRAILDRARELLPRGERDLGALIEELSRLKGEVAREREELSRTQMRLAEREGELKQALSKLESERRERKQAELQARRDLLRTLENQIDEYRKKLRADKKATAETLEEARGLARRVSESIDAETEWRVAPERGVPVDRLREGDKVFVPALQAEGVALSDPDQDGRVRVRIGSATAVLPIGSLRRDAGETKSGPDRSKGEKPLKREVEIPDVPREIDVRGFEPDDAIRAVEAFLENAVMGGVGRARIIHGKGKGILREQLKRWLKDQPAVKEFQLGELREGGTGVTIVTLE